MISRAVTGIVLFIGVHSLALSSAVPADALRVVTTIPDLADIVQKVGGEDVRVDCVARGTEDIHSVRLRPSHLVMTSRADLFVQVGLALEHAWVPGLVEVARNRKLMEGGILTIGDGWPHILEVPKTLDRSAGVDLHPLGNPHINMHPEFGVFAAKKIRDRLKELRPDRSESFDRNFAAYEKKVEQHAKRWKQAGEKLAGKKVVQYHKEFSYICKANGIIMRGALEPKPGVPPTPTHLTRMAKLMNAEGVKVVLHGTWTPGRVAEDAAARAGARALELNSMVQKGEGTWIGYMDNLHQELLAAWGLDLEDDT